MSVVNDLETALQAMQSAKPPGVSGSKIHFITELSVAHVQSESVIIQKLYTHFRKCPGTHKLGPLYVVDSIARRYLDHAKKNHQAVNGTAPDGTFAAGLHRITNLLPNLMSDILQHAPPEENKDKIEKLYAIWERGSTFPPEVLADVKRKMHESPMFQSQNQQGSTTPVGSPPQHLQQLVPVQPVQPAQNAQPSQPLVSQPPATALAPQMPSASSGGDMATMLERLRNLAKGSQSVPTPTPPTVQEKPSATPPFIIPAAQPNAASQPSITPSVSQAQVTSSLSAAPSLPFASTPPNANQLPALQPFLGGFPSLPQQNPMPQAPAAQQQFFQSPAPQQPNATQPQMPPMGMEQLALLQLLLQQPALLQSYGSTEQVAQALGPALGALMAAQQGGQAMNPAMMQPSMWPPQGSQPPQDPPQNTFNNDPRGGRERRYSPPPRSPPQYRGERGRGRSRSRSPERFNNQRPASPPTFRRRSPVYGEYDQGEIRGGPQERTRGGKGRRRGGGSPARRRDRSHGGSPPPKRFMNGNRPNSQAGSGTDGQNRQFPQFPKNVTFDESIGPNRVRVLSRTLFVGGVTVDDQSLRDLFSQYGTVQSCIVNQEKRHAFIKMLTREDAVRAKQGMETYKSDSMTLRTRWGVGFGPRDCSDYQTGISVIPIERLTEADQRWMVSAEYGGTGGKPLVGGMCVEEPDIEIGQGVSSKAISKRFPTDTGAKGPRSSHDHGGPPHGAGGKRKDRDHFKGGDGSAVAARAGGLGAPGGRDNDGVAPPTPGFGMGFPFTMPLMPPNMPPGFQFPGYPGAGR